MKRLLVALAAVLTVSACGTSASDLPLPGSKLSGPSYEVTAQIDDALNLAVGAPVKLNGVTVGRVKTVTAHDFTARITMDVRESSPLHDGASIRLRSTTPLGELFVDVTDKPDGTLLADGDAIDAGEATCRADGRGHAGLRVDADQRGRARPAPDHRARGQRGTRRTGGHRPRPARHARTVRRPASTRAAPRSTRRSTLWPTCRRS